MSSVTVLVLISLLGCAAAFRPEYYHGILNSFSCKICMDVAENPQLYEEAKSTRQILRRCESILGGNGSGFAGYVCTLFVDDKLDGLMNYIIQAPALPSPRKTCENAKICV